MLQAEISYVEWGYDGRNPPVYVHAYIDLLQPRSWVALWNGPELTIGPAAVKLEAMRL